MELNDIKSCNDILDLDIGQLLSILNEHIKTLDIKGTEDRLVRHDMINPIITHLDSIPGINVRAVTTTNTKLEITIDKLEINLKVGISKTKEVKKVSKLRSKYVKIPNGLKLEKLPEYPIHMPIFDYDEDSLGLVKVVPGWMMSDCGIYFGGGDKFSNIFNKEWLINESREVITDDMILQSMFNVLLKRIYRLLPITKVINRRTKTEIKRMFPQEFHSKIPQEFQGLRDFVKNFIRVSYNNDFEQFRKLVIE